MMVVWSASFAACKLPDKELQNNGWGMQHTDFRTWTNCACAKPRAHYPCALEFLSTSVVPITICPFLMRQLWREMAKLLLLVLLSSVVVRSLTTNGLGMLPRTTSSNFPADILRDYAEGAAKLKQRVNGNEELLVVQDSAIEPSLRDSIDEVEEAGGADKTETSGDSHSGSGGVDGSAESGSGSGDAAAAFREWLAAELVRMTTVIYDCKDGSETIGDWRNESVGARLPRNSESYTKDSESAAVVGSRRSELPRVREERFLFGEDDREFVTQSSSFPQCAVARVSTASAHRSFELLLQTTFMISVSCSNVASLSKV